MAPPAAAWCRDARSITVVLNTGSFYVNRTLSPICAVGETCLYQLHVEPLDLIICTIETWTAYSEGGPERGQHCLLGSWWQLAPNAPWKPDT